MTARELNWRINFLSSIVKGVERKLSSETNNEDAFINLLLVEITVPCYHITCLFQIRAALTNKSNSTENKHDFHNFLTDKTDVGLAGKPISVV